LPITVIDRQIDVVIEPSVTNIVDYADDSRPQRLASGIILYPFADRVFVREKSARERFTEHSDDGRALIVAVVEEPAGAQRYAHRAEIVRIDRGDARNRRGLHLLWLVAFREDIISHLFASVLLYIAFDRVFNKGID